MANANHVGLIYFFFWGEGKLQTASKRCTLLCVYIPHNHFKNQHQPTLQKKNASNKKKPSQISDQTTTKNQYFAEYLSTTNGGFMEEENQQSRNKA